MGVALLVFSAACAGVTRPPEPTRPDEIALAVPTQIKARDARLVMSERFRDEIKLTGVTRESPKASVTIVRGDATLLLRGLWIEAAQSIEVRWLKDHENLMVYATQVAVFTQQRDERPYSTEELSALSMANDQVSFFK